MYNHETFYIAGKGFSIRIHNPEYHSYTFDKPNPQWKDMGERWLEIALNKKYLQSVKENWIDVAYLPSIHFQIVRGNKEDNVLPTEWDLLESPKSANFVIMTGNGFFRIQGRYQACDGGFVGSRNKKKADLNPIADSEIVMNLFKVAEKINTPQTYVRT